MTRSARLYSRADPTHGDGWFVSSRRSRACVRQHGSALILLQHRDLVWPLTLFPQHNLYHLPRSIVDSLQQGVADLEVIAFEPRGPRPPGHATLERIADGPGYRRRASLLWTLALNVCVSRERRFDDIAGRTGYRLVSDVTPEIASLAYTRAGQRWTANASPGCSTASIFN